MPNLRQQTRLQLIKGWFDKTILQIVPKKDYYMCTSKLQVHCQFYKLNLQVHLRVEITSTITSSLQCHLQVDLQVHLSVLISILFA